jgi:ABC-2 type transport system ATP-binding protein
MMSDSDVVTVRGLGKADGDQVVVDGLDLDVGQGEVVGLPGANGAGKTTTPGERLTVSARDAGAQPRR